MGYNGEKASVNQYSDLYAYFEKNVATELKELYDENVLREKKINKNELRFTYVPKKSEKITPLVSYDGGMTTLFQGQLTETCMLKIAGACPPDQKGIFTDSEIKEVFFHSFVGKLIHSDTDKEDELKNTLREELKRLLEVDEFVTMLQVFGVKVEEFEDKFFGLVNRWKDKSTIKDTMRELLEWALVIDFLNSQKSKTNEEDTLPFLIIKDGNISSNPKAVTITISHKIQELLEGRNKEIPVPYIVGAVKNSRFTGESPLGKMISKFGKILPSHSFFKIPAAYEALLDKDFASQPFSRFFLNIFGGDSVYEIQIPRVLSDNEVLLPQILDLIASQVTFSYGGSIITNSYAHKRASIAEVEGKMLEVQILKDINNKGEKVKTKKHNHNFVGKVHDIQLTATGSYAYVLAKRDNPDHTPIILGQFILLINPLTLNKGYLCVAEDYKPDMPFNVNAKDSIRNSMEHGIAVDAGYTDNLLYLGYKCRLLGVVSVSDKGDVEFFSNVRSMPSVHQLAAAIPSPDFMQGLFQAAVSSSDNEEENVIFELGHLRYGTNPDDTDCYKVGTENQVSVLFNVSNMLRKRTAIFGKSGYGKSNTVKACIGMIAREKPNCGQLILDTNGEYGLDNDQNQGFMDIFYDAGMKDKVALYTNKNLLSKTLSKHGKNIKPLKFDIFLNIRPSFEIVEANLQQAEPPLYLQPWFSALNAEEDDAKLFQDTKNVGLLYSIYYLALIRAGLKSAQENGNAQLHPKKSYMDYLATRWIRAAKKESDKGEADINEKLFTFEELGDDKKDLLNSENISEFAGAGKGPKFVTTNIEAMAKYANWWNENEKKDDSSIKGFAEVLSNYRRFYVLNTFNVKKDNTQQFIGSLGEEVFNDLKAKKIVIIDLASVSIKVAKSLSKHIAGYVLGRSSAMFGNDSERNAFKSFDALIYIEESQNYLGKEELSSGNSIYERLAKEGRKFHLGLVYVTQQPSAIDMSITSQTENIIALHMSNETDCFILNKVKDKFDALTCRFIKDEAAKGLAYIYAEPHQPFVLPCQIKQFNAALIVGGKKK